MYYLVLKLFMEIKIFCLENGGEFADYELLDTGEGEKLERFGKYIFVRPYEDAVWKKCSTPSVEHYSSSFGFSTSRSVSSGEAPVIFRTSLSIFLNSLLEEL